MNRDSDLYRFDEDALESSLSASSDKIARLIKSNQETLFTLLYKTENCRPTDVNLRMYRPLIPNFFNGLVKNSGVFSKYGLQIREEEGLPHDWELLDETISVKSTRDTVFPNSRDPGHPIQLKNLQGKKSRIFSPKYLLVTESFRGIYLLGHDRVNELVKSFPSRRVDQTQLSLVNKTDCLLCLEISHDLLERLNKRYRQKYNAVSPSERNMRWRADMDAAVQNQIIMGGIDD